MILTLYRVPDPERNRNPNPGLQRWAQAPGPGPFTQPQSYGNVFPGYPLQVLLGHVFPGYPPSQALLGHVARDLGLGDRFFARSGSGSGF